MDERDLQRLVKEELDRTAQTMLLELDRRLANALPPAVRREPRKPFFLRPAFAFAVLVGLSFAVGSLWSRQTLEPSQFSAQGPFVLSKDFSQPRFMARSFQAPREAVRQIAGVPSSEEQMNRAVQAFRSDTNDVSVPVITSRISQVEAQSNISPPDTVLFRSDENAQSLEQPAAPPSFALSAPSPQAQASSPPVRALSPTGSGFFQVQSSRPSETEMVLSLTLRDQAGNMGNSSPLTNSDPTEIAWTQPSSSTNIMMNIISRSQNWSVIASPNPLKAAQFSAIQPARLSARAFDARGNLYTAWDGDFGDVLKTKAGDFSYVPILQGLNHPRGLALDKAGNLYVLESGMGRILRVEAANGEISPNSPVSVFAWGFSPLLAIDRARKKNEDDLGPSYLFINESGELFVGDATAEGTIVYQIAPKSAIPWWKFFCWYRC